MVALHALPDCPDHDRELSVGDDKRQTETVLLAPSRVGVRAASLLSSGTASSR